MKNLRKEVEMGFTKERFPEGTHMCLIYDNDDHRRKIMSQFLAKGVDIDEQVSYFADTTPPDEVENWFKNMGIDILKLKERGTVGIFKAEEVYCPGGKFFPTEMLNRLGSCYDQAIQAGYRGARISGEMTWALKGIPGSKRLMEYEALINTISETHPVTPICQYDARRFDGATLVNVLRVHPLLIVESQIMQNPYYLSPQEFLAKFETEN